MGPQSRRSGIGRRRPGGHSPGRGRALILVNHRPAVYEFLAGRPAGIDAEAAGGDAPGSFGVMKAWPYLTYGSLVTVTGPVA